MAPSRSRLAHAEPIAAPIYITAADAAAILGCHVKTVRRMSAAGRLTANRVGPRMVRYDLDEVRAVVRPIPNAATA